MMTLGNHHVEAKENNRGERSHSKVTKIMSFGL